MTPAPAVAGVINNARAGLNSTVLGVGDSTLFGDSLASGYTEFGWIGRLIQDIAETINCNAIVYISNYPIDWTNVYQSTPYTLYASTLGSAAPTITLWQAGFPGMGMFNYLANTSTIFIPTSVDLAIIQDGFNDSGAEASYTADYPIFIADLQAQYPGISIVTTDANETFNEGFLDNRFPNDIWEALFVPGQSCGSMSPPVQYNSTYGVWAIDTQQAGWTPSLLNPDQLHPNAAGYTLQANYMFSQLVTPLLSFLPGTETETGGQLSHSQSQSPGTAVEVEMGSPVSPPAGVTPMITPLSTPFKSGDFSAPETETGTTASELQTLPVRPMITPLSTPFKSGDFSAPEIETGQPAGSQAGWVPISPMITPFRTPFMSGDASAVETETGGQASVLQFPLVGPMRTPFKTSFITGDFPGTGIEGESGSRVGQGQNIISFLPVTVGQFAVATRNQFAEVSLGITASTIQTAHQAAIANANMAIMATMDDILYAHWLATAIQPVIGSRTAMIGSQGQLSAAQAAIATATPHLKAAYEANGALLEMLALGAGGKMASTISAPLVIEASRLVVVPKSWYADVALNVSIYQGFPYTLPMVFEQSFDSAGHGQKIDGTLAVTAQGSGAAHRVARVGASQAITATMAVTLLHGFEEVGSAALTVTASGTAAMTRSQYAGSTLTVGVGVTPIEVAMDTHADPHLSVVASGGGVAYWGAYAAAGREVAVVLQAGVAMSALLDAYLQADLDVSTNPSHGQPLDAPAQITASTDAMATFGTSMATNLSVSALMLATLPEDAGFFPFYVR